MSPEVTSALIAALVSVVGSAITLIIGLRTLHLERGKLQTERDKVEADRERLQTELRESAQQTRIWQAELAKLKAETDKLAYEADDIRRRRIEAEREEIRNLLLLFDRAVFDAPLFSEEPVQMFNAIRQTRITLQTSGASLVKNRVVAESFQKIRETLLRTESEVMTQYPAIVQLATQSSEQPMSPWERRQQVEQILGGNWYAPVRLMMGLRQEVSEHLDRIRKQLHALDEKVG